jgi:hypothetical protein
MRNIIPILFLSFLISSAIISKGAETDTANKKKLPPIQKFFVGSALDGGIFSTATIQNTDAATNVTTSKNGTLRFSYILNFGFTFNFNLGRHFGLYTCIDIKNIGFIEKLNNGDIAKRRVYNVGAPVGIKVGNMTRKGHYIFLGGGADAPINYKEKKFVIRNQKAKFNEWFSSRTPAIMPYVFAGACVSKGVTLKAQYYPRNFLNPDFTTNNAKPYAGYDVHLILLSIGINIIYSKKHDIVNKHVAELNTI